MKAGSQLQTGTTAGREKGKISCLLAACGKLFKKKRQERRGMAKIRKGGKVRIKMVAGTRVEPAKRGNQVPHAARMTPFKDGRRGFEEKRRQSERQKPLEGGQNPYHRNLQSRKQRRGEGGA